MSEIKSIPGGTLVGVKTSIFTIFNQEKYDSQAIPSAWSAFMEIYRASDLPETTTFYGASIPSMSAEVPMDYYAGMVVPTGTQVPDTLTSIEFPEGNYFCFNHKGPISGLMGSYGQAYGVALPTSGNEMRNAPHLEIYNSEKDPMDPDYEMVIAIPVL